MPATWCRCADKNRALRATLQGAHCGDDEPDRDQRYEFYPHEARDKFYIYAKQKLRMQKMRKAGLLKD